MYDRLYLGFALPFPFAFLLFVVGFLCLHLTAPFPSLPFLLYDVPPEMSYDVRCPGVNGRSVFRDAERSQVQSLFERLNGRWPVWKDV